MIDFLSQPWPWYVAGALIGLTVPALLLLGNKSFGISSSLRHICAACIPSGIPYFRYDWKKEMWNLFFVGGVIMGSLIGSTWLANPDPLLIADSTREALEESGVTDFGGMMPADIFSWQSLLSLRGILFMVVGGFLIGFGTRYAGGCTSGHAITGLSMLQWPSLIATISFMAGGVVMTWLLLPFLIGL